MSSDPQPIGPLAERAAQLARRAQQAPVHRATAEALLPDDYDALGDAVLDDRRLATWQRAIPNRHVWAHLDQFADQPQPVRDEVAGWSQKPDGRNLLIIGPTGVGKSHLAVAAVRQQHFDHGIDVRFLPVVELLDLLRPGGPEGALYDLADTDLLVLDDLGSERATDWTDERMYALINRRWLEERPTVATSNREPEQLLAVLGERVFSRLVGNGAVVLRLTGPDRRRARHA